ncbi:unnamed protein product [Onchocerca flexuosa]|uniref:Extensin-like n=1 Tax=Onchocerca flexuosa TaxID=387005 RepID=A0A183I3Y0_9BILA|nr:unnamed protein product [Onchocerca flexuosa]
MSQTPKQSSRHDSRKQPKIFRASARPLSEVLVVDSRKSRRRAINGQQSTSVAPVPLRKLDSSFHSTTEQTITPTKGPKDQLFRARSTPRKYRRQRLDPFSRSQRIHNPQILEKVPPAEVSREAIEPLQESQSLEGNAHDRPDFILRRAEELPAEAVSAAGRRHSLAIDESVTSVYPNFPPTLSGRFVPPNIHEFPRVIFPMPRFHPALGGAPPGFYLQPQAASGTGTPPGYLPLQAAPGMPPGFIPPGFYPLPQFIPGVSAVPRFYPPSPGTGPAPVTYPSPQLPIGTGGTPFGFYPPLSAIPEFGPVSRFYPPLSQPADVTPEKLDQTTMVPQPVGNEIIGSMLTASATTAVPPTMTVETKTPTQPKTTEEEWLQSEYDRLESAQDRISPQSEPFITAITVPSSESTEFTPQFKLPIARLFGGLFVHNCEEE